MTPEAASAPQSSPAASLYFIGNATMLLHYGELTLLTDPNFLHAGQRAYLGHGLSSRRLTEPAIGIDALPELDGIVLSHLHGDHWDRNAQRGLDRSIPIVTTPRAARRLSARGFRRTIGLKTWESTTLIRSADQVRITALPGRHARGWVRHLLPPVMGSMLEFRSHVGEVGLRLYITGDTLFVADLNEIPQRYPEVDGAVLHLGGTTLPGGLVVTMDGRQGADLLEMIGPSFAVPVHYDDYTVFKSPLSDFRMEVERRGLASRVRWVERGETLELPVRRPEGIQPDGRDPAQ
jgi:L-ascorbate metabolism protein UlaG (beta-lactamase superfamily)